MSIRLFLFIAGLDKPIVARKGKIHRKVQSMITEKIVPNRAPLAVESGLAEQYPWSFVIADAALSRQRYCTGAFSVIRGQQGETLLVAIYSLVSCSWLKKNLQAEFPLTFWAARILNVLPTNCQASSSWQPLRQWLAALRWSYSPWRQFVLMPAWRFEHKSKMLLREGGQEDYRIGKGDGVEIMPWKKWPGCLQQGAGAWIWRQSRHRRILDSQRILFRRAEAYPSDASI